MLQPESTACIRITSHNSSIKAGKILDLIPLTSCTSTMLMNRKLLHWGHKIYSLRSLKPCSSSTKRKDRRECFNTTGWQLGYALEQSQKRTRSISAFKNALSLLKKSGARIATDSNSSKCLWVSPCQRHFLRNGKNLKPEQQTVSHRKTSNTLYRSATSCK